MTELNLEIGKTYVDRQGYCVTIVSSQTYPFGGLLFIGVNHGDSTQYPYSPSGLNDLSFEECPYNLVEEATKEQKLSRSIKFAYTNYRGEHSIRHVLIIKTDWGSTEWHPEPGYLLTALDLEKNEIRQFALSDCNFTKTE